MIVRAPIPAVQIPLVSGETVELDAGAALAQACAEARYEKSIDYARDPVPGFTGEDADWVRERTRHGP